MVGTNVELFTMGDGENVWAMDTMRKVKVNSKHRSTSFAHNVTRYPDYGAASDSQFRDLDRSDNPTDSSISETTD